MRKLLCGLLAAVLICLSAVGCLAADTVEFTDQKDIQNNNAVRMLCDLGLVSGYSDGNFGPQNYIRRVEEKRQNMAERLAKVEASAASAHHRLDDLQERVK